MSALKPHLLALALVGALGTASVAHADLKDRSSHRRPQMLSFFLGLPYYYGFGGAFPLGFGVRYYIPILHDGFIPPVNDEFGIEFGADFAIFSFPGGAVYGASLPVELLWAFHLTPRFDFYGKLGVAIAFGVGRYGGFAPQPVSAHPVTAVGLRFRITDNVVLRAEVGYPWAKVGIAFAI